MKIKIIYKELPAKIYDINLPLKTFKILYDFFCSGQTVAYITNFNSEYVNASSCETAFRYAIKSQNLPIFTMQEKGRVVLERVHDENCGENLYLLKDAETVKKSTHRNSKWLHAFLAFLDDNMEFSQLCDYVELSDNLNAMQSIANRQAAKYNVPVKIYRSNNMLFISRI
ncbi:MAG: hypothetical protein RSF40_02080 [Oscillospiraceae bacterium]